MLGCKVAGCGGISRSRSTSAGSTLTDSHHSTDVYQSLGYPADTLELPEYDYPTPWSVQRAAQPAEKGFQEPLIVRNTFIGTNVLRPSSLHDFYEERQTQSCPASGIGLPPGLEDLVEPGDAAARLIEAEQTWLKTPPPSWLEELPTNEGPCMAGHLLPAGLLDPLADLEPRQISRLSLQEPPMLDVRCLSQYAPAPPHATRQPVILDLQAALSLAFDQPEQQLLPPQSTEPLLGSPECPTVGSEGHWLGTCKPCAFLYTKGCSNGALCSFCHLCDAGEKKRRAKDKRVVLRRLKQGFC